jgi:hypothetical protein
VHGGATPSSGASQTAKTPEQDEQQRRAENCLAKAAYCKWVVSIMPNEELRQFYTRLSVQWQKEAEGERAK